MPIYNVTVHDNMQSTIKHMAKIVGDYKIPTYHMGGPKTWNTFKNDIKTFENGVKNKENDGKIREKRREK